MVLFLLAIAFSRFGRIPLGLDGEKPEYSTISWAAMLFGAGIGIGIIFFGPLEPLTYYVSPLPGLYEPGTVAAVRHGIVEHGDHFELAVAETAPDAGVLADFDSTAEDVTSWYTRTDAEGNPVEYDYDTGTYPDDPPADEDNAARKQ